MLASLRQASPDWQLDLISAAPGPLADEARELGVSVCVMPFPTPLATLGDAAAGGPAGNGLGWPALAGRVSLAMPGTALYLHRLRGMIRRSAPDLVHTNGFKMHLLGAGAAPSTTPVVWHLHDYVMTRPLMRRLLASQVRRCACAIAVSRSVALDAQRALGGSVSIATMHNAIDTRRFTPHGPCLDLDRLAGLPPAGQATIKIGMIGTMARWKGHEVFVRAIASMPRELHVRAYVIGGPLYETDGSQHSIAELEKLARHYDLDGRIGFTGFVTDVPAALRALDIVVHASTEPEPFGLVIAEAMACGKAVITSAAGGASEIITNGVDALAHCPGDHAMLARLIVRLSEDAGLRRRLESAAAEAAPRRFGRGRLAAELRLIYEETILRASSWRGDSATAGQN